MLKPEAQKFWDAPEFERQKVLIVGSTPWEISERAAAHDRELLETPLIKEYLKTLKAPTVVELGCGVGRVLKEFLNDYRCIGLDISKNMLTKAKEYLAGRSPTPAWLGLIENGTLPVNDEDADFVYSFLVFQHIQTKAEITKYMQEVSRVLRSGGYFRVQTHKGKPHPENKFGGLLGRSYPSLAAFKKELDGKYGMDVVEAQEGLVLAEWLWLTLRKR